MRYRLALMALMAGGVSLATLIGCLPSATHVLTLAATPVGAGQIEAQPNQSSYFAGTEITLTAVPIEGWEFRNWVGNGLNTTVNPTRMRIYSDQTVTAVFALIAEGEPAEGEPPAESIVTDGSFEGGATSGAWSLFSSTGMPVICNEQTCDPLNGLGPRTGRHWAWLGTHPQFGIEYSRVMQQVVLPAGSGATLFFHLAIPRAEVNFTFRVFVDESPVFNVTPAEAEAYPSYTPVMVDLSEYADGGAHWISFVFSNVLPDGGKLSDVFLDDIEIIAGV